MATTAEVQLFFVTAVPVEDIVAHAIYLVKEPTKSNARMFKGSADGTAVIPFGADNDSLVHFGSVKPAEDSEAKFWYDPEALRFSIKYPVTEGEPAQWISTADQVVLPDFAGSGEAETMSRSDHHHAGTYVANPQW